MKYQVFQQLIDFTQQSQVFTDFREEGGLENIARECAQPFLHKGFSIESEIYA